MNGVMIGPDSQKNIDALKKADFLVVCEIYPDETSDFWQAPGITADEHEDRSTRRSTGCREQVSPRRTAPSSTRRAGCNGSTRRFRLPGDCRLDQDILAQIFLKIRELYQKEGGKFPDPILNASWSYTLPDHPSLSEVAKEINGKALADITDRESRSLAQSRPAASRALPCCATTARPCAATGSTADRGPKPEPMMQRRGTEDPSGLGHLSELGVVVAGESPRAVQPRVLRS